MNKLLSRGLATLLVMCSAGSGTAQAEIRLNIEFVTPAPPVMVREVYYPPPAPVYVHPYADDLYLDDVRFVAPAEPGFYVAVNVPYDLCYIGNRYYLYRDGYWLRAIDRHGPWRVTGYRELPVVLRQHRIDQIREYRQPGMLRRPDRHLQREERRDWGGPRRHDRDAGREERRDDGRGHRGEERGDRRRSD